MKHTPRLSLKVWAICLLLAGVSLGIACTRIPSDRERLAQELAATYMVKDSVLHNQFELTAQGLAMYDTDTLNPDRVPEALIYWDEAPLFKRMLTALPIDTVLKHYLGKGQSRWDTARFSGLPEPPMPFILDKKAQKPLSGLRVALDPGHVGGKMDYAQYLEEKYVRIHPNPEKGLPEEIGFCEGNLALGTALVLAGKLREAGAEVMLTRDKEGLNAWGGTYERWLDDEVMRYAQRTGDRHAPEDSAGRAAWRVRCAADNYILDYALTGKDANWWRNNATMATVHRSPYLKAEFLERARRINAFKPHVTFIIHYNVGANNNARDDGYRAGVPENYCMAFIPGGFMAGELKEPEDRLAFAAKLLTDDLPKSEQLSLKVVQAHERLLGIPAMTWDDRLAYLKNASLRTPSTGVFSRNLQLTRLIHGTLCFGESLYQDNIEEAKRLNAKDFTLPEMTTPLPNRIRQVADAYFEGLMAWLSAQ